MNLIVLFEMSELVHRHMSVVQSGRLSFLVLFLILFLDLLQGPNVDDELAVLSKLDQLPALDQRVLHSLVADDAPRRLEVRAVKSSSDGLLCDTEAAHGSRDRDGSVATLLM